MKLDEIFGSDESPIAEPRPVDVSVLSREASPQPARSLPTEPRRETAPASVQSSATTHAALPPSRPLSSSYSNRQRLPLQELRKQLTPEERAQLAERQLEFGISEEHPIFMVLLSEICFQQRLDDLNEKFNQTADRVQKTGRIYKFTLSPQMSVGILVLALSAFATVAWEAGAAVVAARLHESVPMYPVIAIIALAFGVVIGSSLHPFPVTKVTKPTQPNW